VYRFHIRRGDFISETSDNNISNTDYYDRAIQIISQKMAHPLFIFFSNDIEWVKKCFNLSNAMYVDWNTGIDDWQDMYLMSQCKHNIIANSTFSWWGAYLNANAEKIVVCPSVFIKNIKTPNIYPAEWVRCVF